MEAHPPSAIAFGDVLFTPLAGDLLLDGRTQRLRPQTAAVLAQLLAQAGELVSREALLQAVWGEILVTENSLTQCIAEIRRALGPGREGWLQTHTRRGYRLEAPPTGPAAAAGAGLAGLPEPSAPAPTAASEVAPAAAVGAAQGARRHWMASAAALLLALAAIWGWRAWHAGPAAPLSLAVLPFEVTGAGGETTWFAEVVGEDLTFNLARIPGARVISRVSTQAYPSKGADLRRVANELGVRYVVAGSVDRQTDQVTMRLQLVETDTGLLRWSERIDTTVAGLHEAERGVANRVANALHVKLVDVESARVQGGGSAHPAAADLALQAWAAWNRGTPAEVARARDLAQQALVLDDRSVMAWKTLASWHLRARINQSLPAEQAEAGAEQAANRALSIDPGHPLVHTVWGAAQVLRGRYAEGRQALEHEIQTNPSHPVAYAYLGIAHLMQGEPRLAIGRYQQALDISPRDPRRSRFERHLALAYLHDGALADAVLHARSATRAPQVDRAAWAVLAAACAAAGQAACVGEARTGLRKAWPDVSMAAVEAEWPPQTAAFSRQHEPFVRALTQAMAAL
jgi:TolB-like protein/DNA-binding winged helix-turn-helix (wHTH) protein/Tfp pilus assembly protein PilF